MKQQTIGVLDAFHVKELDAGISVRVKVLIHILQHIFYPYLFGITYRPSRVKLQSFYQGRFHDEDRRSSRTRNKVYSLGIQIRNRLSENTVVTSVEQADAVRPNQ
ncbi:hypothetical protein SDC9_176790 [bioreactor metagenome]|uniref:Uncharacterized protein n=1 Tax=bioreactor metagenome TaxID=1076179 RepID=A0A645GR15_9ZZZZ